MWQCEKIVKFGYLLVIEVYLESLVFVLTDYFC